MFFSISKGRLFGDYLFIRVSTHLIVAALLNDSGKSETASKRNDCHAPKKGSCAHSFLDEVSVLFSVKKKENSM